MPGKKSAKSSARSRKSSGTGKKKGKKSGKSKGSAAGQSPSATAGGEGAPAEIDILNHHAMDNLYYIAHGPVEALEFRGFGWEDAPKGGKKKGKKGKKK